MGDDGSGTPRIGKRRLAVWLVVCALLGATGYVAGAHLANSAYVDGGVSIGAPDGLVVTVEGQTQMDLSDPTTLSGTINIVTEEGNATFFSAGVANATVHADDIEGTWTNVTSINADQNAVQINPADKQQVTVGGEITAVDFRDGMAADDNQADFAYEGGTGNSRVTASGLDASTSYMAVDAGTGTILDTGSSDSSGTVTFDQLDSGSHTVEIQSDDTNPPVLSNADPGGPENTTVSTFEIDVNDADFPRGDTVTAELFVEGDSKGTDTLTSNGTATVNYNVDLGQSVDFSWVATDDYGNQDIENYTLTTPVNVTFREEHNASKVVTGANATITLYSDDATIVVERSDDNDDGNISLEGLPDKEFVAVVESDDHYPRRVYIESIFEQQSIFLLNQTAVPGDEAVNTTFTFEDRTGEFPPENSTLRVQRALDVNDDGEFEWLTVAGDFWGAASEFPFTGQENARYRLIVENQEGDRRVLGTHIPTDDGVKNVINGEIRFEDGAPTGRFFDADLSGEAGNIQVLYQDPTNSTGDLRVRIWELGNQSNTIYDQNYTDSPYGQLLTTVDLTDEQATKSWTVRIDGQTDGGNEIELQTTTGSGLGTPLPMDPWLLGALSVITLTFVGSMYGPRTATLGSWVLVATATGLTALGWIGIPGIALVAAAVIAAGGTIYSEAVP